MINKVETGKRIASLRSKLGYSQAVFAEKLNVSPQAVSKWETGQMLPDVDILLILSWICRVTINEILDSEEVFVDQLSSVGREMLRMNKFLICPECKTNLSLRVHTNGGLQYFECESNHRYNVEDGVVYFNSREIRGEEWSLYLRNYEHYLQGATSTEYPRYGEGEIPDYEVTWREIEKLRPATILDIACGMGVGIQPILKRINWPCTVILADLSFRVLAWNCKYFNEEIRNPYIDYVFLACDCANIPLMDNSVDVVVSNYGFESMQNKMMAGFKEAYRVLKPEGKVVYTKSFVENHDSENTKKWKALYLANKEFTSEDRLHDISQWFAECKKVGFIYNESFKIYGEMPAPDVSEFPFENNMARWMECHVVISEK